MDGSLRDNTDLFSERHDPNAIKVCEFNKLIFLISAVRTF